MISKTNESMPKHSGNRNMRGFTFLEVTIALFLLSFLFVGIAGALGQFSSQQRQIMSRLSMMNLTANLRRTLVDDSALLNTIFNTNNNVFDCLRAPTLQPLDGVMPTVAGCENKGGTLNNLLNSAGQQLIDLSDPTAGFTSSGEPCTGYGTDPKCNVRVRIDVRFICDHDPGGATACSQPQMVFTGSLEILGDGPGDPVVKLDQIFEIRKDWALLKTNLVELGRSQTSSASANPPAFKLAIIVDNSTSMTSYQQKLSASLDPLFESLKTSSWDLDVQLYTSTQFLMAQLYPWENKKPLNSDKQVLKLASVSCSNGVTTKDGYCEDLPMFGTQNEKYELKAPLEMILPAHATDAQFSTFKSAVLNAVTAMGVSGSDDEQSLCTLSRLLTGGNGFIKTGDRVGVILISNEQDHSTAATCATEIGRAYAANGILDFKDERVCRDEATFDPVTEFSVYYVKQQVGSAGYRIDFTCQQQRDGSFVPYDPKDPSTYISDSALVNFSAVGEVSPSAYSIQNFGIDLDKTCAQSGIAFTNSYPYSYGGDNVTMQAADCPASVRDAIAKQPHCGAYTDKNGTLHLGRPLAGIEGCRISCNDLINYGFRDVNPPSSHVDSFRQVENLQVNYCVAPLSLGTSVEHDTFSNPSGKKETSPYKKIEAGNDYANITTLFTSENAGVNLWVPFPGGGAATSCCRTNYYHRPFPTGIGDVYKSIFEPFNTQHLKIEDAIVERADATLGPDGYFISSIINPSSPTTACPAKSDESVGSVFEALAGKIANSALVPICSADYSPALKPLQEFIQKSISTRTPNDLITLSQGQQIVQIYVNNGVMDFQFPVAGPMGVWPTLIEKVAASTSKTYRLDFSRTGYTLTSSDRVWALVANQSGGLSLSTIGSDSLSFDDIRSLYRLGLGH